MNKTNTAALILSLVAAVMSAAALALGIVALVKSCAKRNVSIPDYNYLRSDGDDDEEENIGSDTLAF